MSSCYQCKKPLTLPEKIGFREDCPYCSADLHVCSNCDFYDPKIYNECRETQADRIIEKNRANYCEYFILKKTGGNSGLDPAAEAKRKLEELFKKK